MIKDIGCKLASLSLENITGIKATGHEILEYSCYVSSFIRAGKGEIEAGANWFMDIFGLDLVELGLNYGDTTECKIFGWNLLETPEFKEYCQNHVQEWREEREFI
jgi:hypothetical protein